jgi:hypothetical protein
MFGLNKNELKIFKKLNSAIKIQDFLDKLPANLERDGETYMSPRKTLGTGKAHCLEGALLAATALWINGQKPLLLDLKTLTGDDHVVALYRVNKFWGAISKTNHATLRFRDPIYETIHELALSYFHEYFDNKTGKKILCSYSEPFDLSKYKKDWITSEEDLFDLADDIDNSIHYELYSARQKKFIRKADKMELQAGNITEWKD